MQDDFLIHIFCLVDDFCKEFESAWKSYLLTLLTPKGDTRNKRSPKLYPRNFKNRKFNYFLPQRAQNTQREKLGPESTYTFF